MRIVLLAALAAAGGCADLLSYDDYRARPADAAVPDVSTEAAVDAATDVATPDQGMHPPLRPAGAIAPSGKGKTLWLVVNHFYLNQRDVSSDTPSSTAWKTLGYDVDHVCTSLDDSKQNIGTCHRAKTATQDTLVDGDACRDNNFGSQIVPLVNLVDGEFEKTSNEHVLKGVNTWLLALEDLDDGPDDPYVVGKLYKAAQWADYGVTMPAFDGTDVRQVESESVVDGNLDKPRTIFTQGYLANDVFVSGEPGYFEATLPLQGVSTTLPLSGGVFVLRLDRAHELGTFGTIAGGIAADKVVGLLNPITDQAGICPGDPLYTGLVSSIAKAMDLVVDAPNMQNTMVDCNAMSVGLAFTTAKVQPPVEVVPTPPRSTRCTMSDAGPG